MPSQIATRMLQVYETRNRLLGADLFHAPAWEILLLLETADQGLEGRELRERMNTPGAALQRWIDVLVARDLVAAAGEHLMLTAKARAALDDVLTSALREPAVEA